MVKLSRRGGGGKTTLSKSQSLHLYWSQALSELYFTTLTAPTEIILMLPSTEARKAIYRLKYIGF